MKNKFEYPTFYSFEEVARYYRGYWLDKDIVRFFGTRITSHFKRITKNKYVFISTYRSQNGERIAALRLATIKQVKRGQPFFETYIGTLEDFPPMTLSQAVREFKKLKRF